MIAQSYNSDYTTAKLHVTQIQGITDLHLKPTDRLFGRSMLRGWEILIILNRESFGSPGELYLFAAMLDHFLRGFATESCFTQTIVEDVHGGKRCEWPVKTGKRPYL
ncbi:MAG: type VI secretion system baseplate subunit TssF [Desulfuromonadaceae bacterium]|nr:type VI secretion system baseplate subunit TssF [Desulfobulbus sp.]MDD2850264.1 type VI secretion system baseplate subunit TssF [Desulfuromonadaceae bacterium]